MLTDIKNSAQRVLDAVGTSASVISESDAVKIAGSHNCRLVDVYIAALSTNIWPLRYLRNRGSLTAGEQKRLAESSAVVVGCGGLGGYVVLMLARIGLGKLGIVDPDTFDETNLNRQAFASFETIGTGKAVAAVAAVKSINPAVTTREFATALNEANAAEILTGADVVIDALDNLPDREMLRRLAHSMGMPLVHGAIAGFEGQVMTILPDDQQCETCFENSGDDFQEPAVNAESHLGVLSVTPVLIASLQAMEAVKILLKRGKPLNGRMLYADMELGQFDYFNF